MSKLNYFHRRTLGRATGRVVIRSNDSLHEAARTGKFRPRGIIIDLDPTRSNASLAARGSDRAGIIVIDRARKILFKNRVAERVLDSGSSLFEHQQTLGSRTQSIDMHLRAAVLSAGSGPDAFAAPRLMHLPRTSGMPLLGLMVPLDASAPADLGALLLFWDTQITPVPSASVLQQLFGLTPTEALIAIATCEGRTPAAIAASRQRSVTTIRTLLSRVFSKCAVQRQAELVRLLAGIGNAWSFADGVSTGMEIQRTIHSGNGPQASPLHMHDGLVRQLVQAGGMKAVVHIKDLAPGEGTAPHYHSCGHEVLCVMRGNLTTVFGPGDRSVTAPGESRYVGENVLHRGHNADASKVVRILSINVTPRGSSSRVEVPSIP
jgi:DNA-binding CsgD family transcriptional regulator/quercetin dioxygenase-like cupin family protein